MGDKMTKRLAPCPACRGGVGCDCEYCFGKGQIQHPRDAADALAAAEKRVEDLERRLRDANDILYSMVWNERTRQYELTDDTFHGPCFRPSMRQMLVSMHHDRDGANDA